MKSKLFGTATIAALMAFGLQPAMAQQKLKIGFITTLSGPTGGIGKHMKDSVEIALDHLGRKVGGLETEVIFGDDQQKPDVGVQVAEEMLKKNQVDFMSGIIWSNVMMAVAPVVTGAGKIMVGANAGPSPLAGAQCNELFFSTSWNNDQSPEAMGKFMQDKGINDVYVLAPNYQAGKDMVAGLKRYYKGRDRRGDLHQARPAGLPGRDQPAALEKSEGRVRLLPRRHGHPVREAVRPGRPARADPALHGVHRGRDHHAGAEGSRHRPVRGALLESRPEHSREPEIRGGFPEEVRLYALVLRRAELRRDHADRFRAKATKGNVKDTKALVAAMRKANFNSIRGKFTYNVNHLPIQDFYLLRSGEGSRRR